MTKLVDLIYRLKSGCIANELDIMTEAGLTLAEYSGIAAMEKDKIYCGSDLSRKMNLSPSRASRVVDKLVRNGYFKRDIDTADRRKCNITLDEKGIQLKKRIDFSRETCEQRIREKLSAKEINSLSGTLQKVIDVL
ncbi:MAG: MarR family transcriptional regulator [bacterium]|nr:MarR family transcriptional regulator [bacterium]